MVWRIQVNRNIPKQWYPLQAGTKTGFYPLWSKFEAFCRPGLCKLYHPDSGKSRTIVCQHTPAPLRKGFSDGAGIGKLCLSYHLSQEGLGGIGIASGNKWLQRSSCPLPQHMALRCLCSSKTVIGTNEILLWVKTDSNGKITNSLYFLTKKIKPKKTSWGHISHRREMEQTYFHSLFPSCLWRKK